MTGAMNIYVDGVLNAGKKGPTEIRNDLTNLRIGSIQTGVSAGFLNGTIDQVQIYDYVLTPTEVAYIHNHTEMLIPPLSQ